jgi:Fibronectin type III domain/Beta-propeller repeat/PQQ-like domain
MRAAVIAIVVGAVLAPPAMAETPQEIRFHGGAYDSASAIATDAGGNSYVAGYSESREGKDSFVVIKLGPDGAVRWTARYDGSRGGVGGQADAVTVDAAGNVYAAGFIHDGVMFAQNYDYLVVKFGPDGAQRWAHRYNGPGNVYDFARAIAVDGAGNVYVTGFSHGTGYGYDWATLKLSPTGTLLWERRLSGPANESDDRASELALLPGGDLVVAGVTQTGGEQFPDNDVELVAYDPQGTVVWQRRWSDTAISHEFVFDLDVDGSGRIAITGTTQENTSPYVPPLPLTQRYDGGGTLLQTIRTDGGSSVDVDGAGNFFVAGSFVSSPSTVAKFSAAGARVWSTPLTFGDFEFLSMPVVAADAAGAVTVAGTLRDTSTHNDHFLTIRYAADGRELWRHRFAGEADAGQRDQVADLAIDAAGAALVTGTSWNGYISIGGTAEDIVTLKFAAGAAPALGAPTGLQASALSASQIRLTWQDNAGTEDGFRIERCAGLGCTAFTQIAVVGHDVTSYVDGGLARNSQYSYRVRAFNAGGVSAYTNVATTKTRRK